MAHRTFNPAQRPASKGPRISPAPVPGVDLSPSSGQLMKPRSSSTHRLAPFADSSPRVHCQRTAWDAAFAFRIWISRCSSPRIAASRVESLQSHRGLICHNFANIREYSYATVHPLRNLHQHRPPALREDRRPAVGVVEDGPDALVEDLRRDARSRAARRV